MPVGAITTGSNPVVIVEEIKPPRNTYKGNFLLANRALSKTDDC